jgi:hypothetical protein
MGCEVLRQSFFFDLYFKEQFYSLIKKIKKINLHVTKFRLPSLYGKSFVVKKIIDKSVWSMKGDWIYQVYGIWMTKI